MTYLIVLLIPPLYFVIRGKWGAFVLNAFLYAMALLTVFIFGIGVLFWILAVGHAAWHLQRELMEEHAEMIASKLAERTPE